MREVSAAECQTFEFTMLAQFGADVDFLHDGYSHSKEIEDTFFCAGNQMEQAEWVVQETHSAA